MNELSPSDRFLENITNASRIVEIIKENAYQDPQDGPNPRGILVLELNNWIGSKLKERLEDALSVTCYAFSNISDVNEAVDSHGLNHYGWFIINPNLSPKGLLVELPKKTEDMMLTGCHWIEQLLNDYENQKERLRGRIIFYNRYKGMAPKMGEWIKEREAGFYRLVNAD